jgi:hypothetical protein
MRSREAVAAGGIAFAVHAAVWGVWACTQAAEQCVLATAFLGGSVASALLGVLTAFVLDEIRKASAAPPRARDVMSRLVVPPLDLAI